MAEKLIITDIDGVVLNWHDAFVDWMQMQGYKSSGIKHHDADIHLELNITFDEAMAKKYEFNSSLSGSCLQPYGNSDIVIPQLFEQGYKFIGITSYSDQPIAQYYRYLNLEEYVPTESFAEMRFLPSGSPKAETLEAFRDTNLYYVDDRIINVNTARNVGMKPIIMRHDYNLHFDHPVIQTVTDWFDIARIVAKEV